jgi:hypothetical protein
VIESGQLCLTPYYDVPFRSLFATNGYGIDHWKRLLRGQVRWIYGSFSNGALGHKRFTGIDRVDNNGLDVYGSFHSDRWGGFKTYFKFHPDSDAKFVQLDIGQQQ